MKKFLKKGSKKLPSKKQDKTSDLLKLKSIIRVGSCVTLLETTYDKKWTNPEAFTKRIIVKIEDNYKITFDKKTDMPYWRHPAYYIHNETINLKNEDENSYILTITLHNHKSIYRIEK